MGTHVHDVLNKVEVYDTLNWIFLNGHFLIWFEIIIIFQKETEICKESLQF